MNRQGSPINGPRARHDINEAREAFMQADGHRQAQCARSAIDSAAAILVDAGANSREVVAAHSFLREARALDGRPHMCSAECADTVREASTLPPETRSGSRTTCCLLRLERLRANEACEPQRPFGTSNVP
jgi:hypothetical protein